MTQPGDRILAIDIELAASQEFVWQAWTTETGVRSFFAPQCRIELKPGGAYEMYFDPQAPAGSRGGEGNTVMALDQPHMLSFSWNFPPGLPTIRDQRTLVTVYLTRLSPNTTRLRLRQAGWSESDAWAKGYEYFDHAWRHIVLPRLQRACSGTAMDWKEVQK